MTTLIAILGCAVLSLVNPVSLEPSHCGVDHRLTPSDNVLAGTNTPVFFFRSDKNSPLGHTLVRQLDAMTNLKSQSSFFKESGRRRIDNNNECSQSSLWAWELDEFPQCAAPSTIYRKILVVVDYGIYQRYEKMSNQLTKLLEYVLAIWNGVDLNFRTLANPKMRLNIAGIVVEEHADELPFLSHKHKDGRLIADTITQPIYQFFESNGSSWSNYFGQYDTVTVMTSNKITDITDLDGVDRLYQGYGWTMCDRRTLGPRISQLFADDEGWLRIRPLSELLGWSFHNHNHTCPPGHSAIGNYNKDITKDLPDWSKCYLDVFKKLFNSRQAACYFKKPDVISPLPRVMYGEILDCDGQCAMKKGTKCCKRESICQDLLCQTSDGCKPIGIYAADGTSCGDEKICFRRRCVFRKDVE